jgi:hypothetical protein
MTWRFYKDPVTLRFIFLLLIIGILAYLEYKWGVDKEIIIISISVISATVGYFITHFLENERKRIEEKTKLYSKLVSDLRIFMKGGEKPDEDSKSFEDTYYASWLYISTNVYEKLIAYIEKYQVFSSDKTEKNKTILNETLEPLMQAIRDEFTVDKKVKFVNYILESKK